MSTWTVQVQDGHNRGIHDLPAEILGEILGSRLNNTVDDPFLQPGRLVPLEVCRLWMDTGPSNPACWTRLDIAISMKRSDSAIYRRLEDRFLRAQNLPVDLTLGGREHDRYCIRIWRCSDGG